MYKDPHKYDEIINIPYVKSKQHKWMSRENRAAQFAPFAALNGHAETMEETKRRVDTKIELDDDAYYLLNQKIQTIIESNQKEMTITYFVHDAKKEGGSYQTYSGVLKKFNPINKTILMDTLEIKIEDIIDIDSPIFNTSFLDK